MSAKLKPVGDRIVVSPEETERKTAGGLILPDTAGEKPQRGTVLAVGSGRIDIKGNRIPPAVKEGDEILYSKYGGTELKVDDEELLILRESDILTVVEDE